MMRGAPWPCRVREAAEGPWERWAVVRGQRKASCEGPEWTLKDAWAGAGPGASTALPLGLLPGSGLGQPRRTAVGVVPAASPALLSHVLRAFVFRERSRWWCSNTLN